MTPEAATAEGTEDGTRDDNARDDKPRDDSSVAEPLDEKSEENEEEDDKVLDLASLTAPRRLVKLPTKDKPRGEVFELRMLEDFGIERQQELLQWSRRYETLMNSDKQLSDTERTRLRSVFDSLFDAVLDAPQSVKKTMRDHVRRTVVQAFSMGPMLQRQEAQMEIIRRLIDRDYLTQDQVDEVTMEIRDEFARQQSTSES